MMGGGSSVFVQNGFAVDATNKIFCKKLIKAETMDFSNPDPETFAPTREDYVPEEGDGVSQDEVCYSTDREKAFRNVWRYGVYNAGDGSRLELENQAFPLEDKQLTKTETNAEFLRSRAIGAFMSIHFNRTGD